MTLRDLPFIAKLRPVLTDVLTPRLAFGLVILSSLVGVWFINQLINYKSSLVERYNALENEIAIVSLENGFEIWQERLNEIQEAEAAWDETLWKGRTAGIIAASAQSALSEIAQTSELESVQISVASDTIQVDGREFLRFEIVATALPKAALSALLRLSIMERAVIFSEVEMPLRSSARTRLTIRGYIPVLFVENVGSEVSE